MKIAPFEVNVSAKFGAPMGRASDDFASFIDARVQLREVPMVDGDYDPGGAYWGGGSAHKVFCSWGKSAQGEPIVCYFRATSRDEAKRNLRAEVRKAYAKITGVTNGGKVTVYKAIPKGANVKASDTFVDAYITCALWSTNDESTPEGGEPFDSNYSADDMTDECKASMRADCDAFVKANAADVARVADDSQAGHDFWLTRNGHGAGFWDRDLGALGERLTKACKSFGETGLYLGDDKKIHAGG